MKTASIDNAPFADKNWDEAIDAYNKKQTEYIRARVNALGLAKPRPIIHVPDEAVGDITSTERGSGARYNKDKPDFSLIPLHFLSRAMLHDGADKEGEVIGLLGDYQETQDTTALFRAMTLLGNDGWEECARVFMYGKKKYAAWNWAKGMAWSVPLACAVRHLLAMADGEELDPESGLPHRGHVYCNIVMLLTYEVSYPEGNDFPPRAMFVAPVPVGEATEFP